ncbi:MAG: hypothetical protein ABJO09_21455 [Hyphomicrobiales bacterium]
MLKKLALAATSIPALSNQVMAHADPHAHGVVMAQVPHLHFGSDQVIAFGAVGVFVAGLIVAVVITGSATKAPRKRR